MQLASFSMAEVTYATGDISYLVQEQAKQATFRIKAKQENVSGVVLPAFEAGRVPGSGMSCRLESGCMFTLTHRLQFDWSWERWSTDHKIKRGLCQSP